MTEDDPPTPPATRVPMLRMDDDCKKTVRIPTTTCPNFRAAADDDDDGPVVIPADAYRELPTDGRSTGRPVSYLDWIPSSATKPDDDADTYNRPTVDAAYEYRTGYNIKPTVPPRAVVRIRAPLVRPSTGPICIVIVVDGQMDPESMRTAWSHVRFVRSTVDGCVAVVIADDRGPYVAPAVLLVSFDGSKTSSSSSKSAGMLAMHRLTAAVTNAIKLLNATAASRHIIIVSDDSAWQQHIGPIDKIPIDASTAADTADSDNISIWTVAITSAESMAPRGELLAFFSTLTGGRKSTGTTYRGYADDDAYRSLRNPLFGVVDVIRGIVCNDIAIEITAPANKRLLIRSRGGGFMDSLASNSVRLVWSSLGIGAERFCLVETSPETAAGPIAVRIRWSTTDGRSSSVDRIINIPVETSASIPISVVYSTTALLAHASQLLRRASETIPTPSAAAVAALLTGCLTGTISAGQQRIRSIVDLLRQSDDNDWRSDGHRIGTFAFCSRSLYFLT